MSSLSFEDFRYDIRSFIKQVKNDVGFTQLVKVFPIRDRALAVSRMNGGTPEIELPVTPIIMRDMGISEKQAVARSKVAVVEEFCHLKHDQDHTPTVFECVRSRVERFLSPDEQELVAAKMARFKAQAEEGGGEASGASAVASASSSIAAPKEPS